jgi:glycerol-3-phosphate dehydrogenase
LSVRDAVIIGGGIAGAAVAHDLVLRGLRVEIIERGDLAAATSALHHGVLHCGARYAVSDPRVAEECYRESTIVRRIAAESVDCTSSLFVATTDAEAELAERFVTGCRGCGIPVTEVTPSHALDMEPRLTPRLLRTFETPDASFEPRGLALRFLTTAIARGASFRTFTAVERILSRSGRVSGVVARSAATGAEVTIRAEAVVNAAGPWAGEVCALAGIAIAITPIAGALYSVPVRLCDRVIHRLALPGDGDTIVPRGASCVVGSNAWLPPRPWSLSVPDEMVSAIRSRVGALLPDCLALPPGRVWAACRPLFGTTRGVGRDLSRSFTVVDHERDGWPGLLTIVSSKATTARAAAEAAADLVCRRCGNDTRCRTGDVHLDP